MVLTPDQVRYLQSRGLSPSSDPYGGAVPYRPQAGLGGALRPAAAPIGARTSGMGQPQQVYPTRPAQQTPMHDFFGFTPEQGLANPALYPQGAFGSAAARQFQLSPTSSYVPNAQTTQMGSPWMGLPGMRQSPIETALRSTLAGNAALGAGDNRLRGAGGAMGQNIAFPHPQGSLATTTPTMLSQPYGGGYLARWMAAHEGQPMTPQQQANAKDAANFWTGRLPFRQSSMANTTDAIQHSPGMDRDYGLGRYGRETPRAASAAESLRAKGNVSGGVEWGKSKDEDLQKKHDDYMAGLKQQRAKDQERYGVAKALGRRPTAQDIANYKAMASGGDMTPAQVGSLYGLGAMQAQGQYGLAKAQMQSADAQRAIATELQRGHLKNEEARTEFSRQQLGSEDAQRAVANELQRAHLANEQARTGIEQKRLDLTKGQSGDRYRSEQLEKRFAGKVKLAELYTAGLKVGSPEYIEALNRAEQESWSGFPGLQSSPSLGAPNVFPPSQPMPPTPEPPQVAVPANGANPPNLFNLGRPPAQDGNQQSPSLQTAKVPFATGGGDLGQWLQDAFPDINNRNPKLAAEAASRAAAYVQSIGVDPERLRKALYNISPEEWTWPNYLNPFNTPTRYPEVGHGLWTSLTGESRANTGKRMPKKRALQMTIDAMRK